MSDPQSHSTATPPPAEATPIERLAELRAQLDGLDTQIHDLLMQRAAVVERVGALGAKGRVPLRPGREADIIRRLLARHTGRLPRRTIVRIWRELVAGTTTMQGNYTIAVCQTDPAAGFIACAREHFGSLTPIRAHRTPAQAIGEVSASQAVAAVLPMPSEDDSPGAAWWTALLHRDEPRIHVVARLPFWQPRSEGAPRVQALVVCAAAPDRSQDDRSLLGLECADSVSRARLSAMVTAAGFTAGDITIRRAAGSPVAYALVDVAGFVADDDPRLTALPDLLRKPVVLGAYAIPVDGDAA
ncbi:MAG: chorismate mutase [Alphaproteobacteria bacterium]|nr:chorismate mutase [Alphaproteobacteria bacterium]